MRPADLLETLFRVACDVHGNQRNRVAAAIVLKNEIISVGVNGRKTSPWQRRFTTHPEKDYIHAETAAIKNSLKRISMTDLKKSTLFVARAKFPTSADRGIKSVWGMSCPCRYGCRQAIDFFEIPRVYYTTDEPGVVGVYR